jgi:hypothetical protein
VFAEDLLRCPCRSRRSVVVFAIDVARGGRRCGGYHPEWRVNFAGQYTRVAEFERVESGEVTTTSVTEIVDATATDGRDRGPAALPVASQLGSRHRCVSAGSGPERWIARSGAGNQPPPMVIENGAPDPVEDHLG